MPKRCGTRGLTKISSNQLFVVFTAVFQCFYVIATRLQLRYATKKVNALFGHDALEGVHIHENTLCVTSGAHRFGTNFRSLARCSKYTAIHMLSGTHVRQTTLCVTFGARLRLVRSSLLGRLFGHLRRQDSPSTPERSRRATIWAPNNTQGCHPDLTSTRPRLL